MYISASAPDAPPFSDTTIGCFIKWFFWIAACIIRAIWSEAPPAPAATTISTGLVGSQAAIAGTLTRVAEARKAALIVVRTVFPPCEVIVRHCRTRSIGGNSADCRSQVQEDDTAGIYDFRMGGRYLPFQFGGRLLRKASIPSRKSSLM